MHRWGCSRKFSGLTRAKKTANRSGSGDCPISSEFRRDRKTHPELLTLNDPQTAVAIGTVRYCALSFQCVPVVTGTEQNMWM